MALTTVGQMRQEVILDAREDVDDGRGNVITTWVEKVRAPARIRVLKGHETVMAGRLQGIQTAVITMRMQPAMEDAEPSWRCRDARKGTVYNIRAITPDERGAFVDLLAESGVPA